MRGLELDRATDSRRFSLVELLGLLMIRAGLSTSVETDDEIGGTVVLGRA